MKVYDVLLAIVTLLFVSLGSQNTSAETQSHFVRQSRDAETLIIFVHGVRGDGQATWTKGNSYWPSLLTSDRDFDGTDIFVHSYPDSFSAPLSIDELADNMRITLTAYSVLKYRHLVFLAHSMGGIVTRSYLLKNRDAASRTLFTYFFATPSSGSEIASVFALFYSNPPIEQLKSMSSMDYLADQVRQWLAAKFPFPTYCGYETLKTAGAFVVEMKSAALLCTKRLDPIVANHVDIVKPTNEKSDSYLAFKAAYLDEQRSIRSFDEEKRIDHQFVIDYLRDRSKKSIRAMDDVISIFSSSSKSNRREKKENAKVTLKRMRPQFVGLQERHIDAVVVGDILAAHKLAADIRRSQNRIIKTIQLEIGRINNYSAARFQYTYGNKIPHQVGHDEAYAQKIAALQEQVGASMDKRIKDLAYPGLPPDRVPAELLSLAFETE